LEEAHVLSRLIQDLRTLSLSEADALQLQKEPSDLVALAREVTESMQPEAAKHSVSLSVATTADTAVLDLDPLRIREVLTNLISNALRHTPAGRAATVAVTDAQGTVSVAVTDTGEGMAPEEVMQ